MNKGIERNYIILGAGGHAVVIADILYKCGNAIKGYLDDAIPEGTEILGAKVLGKISDCNRYREYSFIIGIGDNKTRKHVAEAYSLEYGTAIHPSATIGQQVEIGSGTVVMAGCVINPRTVMGRHCIVNTAASIDHDNVISDYVHVSPGAAIGGTVTIGAGAHVGLGASIKNNIRICDEAVIGAGAVVVKTLSFRALVLEYQRRKSTANLNEFRSKVEQGQVLHDQSCKLTANPAQCGIREADEKSTYPY